MQAQLTLFPDGQEVREEVMRSLERFDLPAARARCDAVRRCDPGLPGMELLDAAIAWLERKAGGVPEAIAAAFCDLASAGDTETMAPEVAELVDLAVARCAVRVHDGRAPFIDPAQRLHFGSVLLVLDRAEAAREWLRSTLFAEGRGFSARADLWGYLGDACTLVEREREAQAAYVRALVVDPQAVDLRRLRHGGLRHAWQDLRGTGPDAARGRLLVSAWRCGVLDFPRGDDTLAHLRGPLREGALQGADADAPEAERHRRFGVLAYVDRSLPAGQPPDVDARAAMQDLDATLFAEYMRAVARAEA